MAKKKEATKKPKRTYICKEGYLKKTQKILRSKGYDYSISHISNTALKYQANPVILEAIMEAKESLGLSLN